VTRIFRANKDHCPSTLTAALALHGHDADRIRQVILDRHDMSLGPGLGPGLGRLAVRLGFHDSSRLTVPSAQKSYQRRQI